jgi:hypothetical protein
MFGDLCTASFSFVHYLAGLNDPTLLRLDVDTKLSDQLKVIQFWIALIVALGDIYETLPEKYHCMFCGQVFLSFSLLFSL